MFTRRGKWEFRSMDLAISTRRNFEKYFKIATDAFPKC